MNVEKSNKKTININFNSVVKRFKEATSVRWDREVASLLGFSGAAFSERKKRGTIPKREIEVYCLKNSINVDWVLVGEGEMFNQKQVEGKVQGSYNSESQKIQKLEGELDSVKDDLIDLLKENNALTKENADLKIRLARMETELQEKPESQGRREVG